MRLKMYNTVVSIFGLCLLSQASVKDSIVEYDLNPTQYVTGKLKRLDKFPSKFVTPRHVDIWLPQNFDGNKTYSVLYMNDGQMLFNAGETWNNQEWGVDEHLSELMALNQIKETIVVGIWNVYTERNSNYFPERVFDNLDEHNKKALQKMAANQNQVTTVNSDNYLKFIVQELKPYIDTNYPTKTGREDTTIMGSSRGGLISMYALCEYPEVFGAAACLSTHWIGTYTNVEANQIPYALMNYLMEQLPPSSTHKIYFDYGTETLDALYLPYQDLVTTALEYASYDDQSMRNLKFEGHDHSENSWKKRLKTPLKFILN